MISMKSNNSTSVNQRKMALSMKKKQQKYWGNINNINLMLFIVVLLDPRHKWKYVNWIISRSYNEETTQELCSRTKNCVGPK